MNSLVVYVNLLITSYCNWCGLFNERWHFQVYPMYKAFIEPDLETAHIKIINKFNPFSGFQNPMYILKARINNILFRFFFVIMS
jgi:hypothetical protein